MATPSAANIPLGRGSIYFDQFDANGAPTGFLHLGNCDKFAINTDVTTLDVTNYMSSTREKYLSLVTDIAPTLNITGFEFDDVHWGLLTYGANSNYTQTSGSVTGEVLLPATATNIKGKTLFTKFRKISAVTVKQGVTTLVANTDYTIDDANNGQITLLASGSTVADGTVITVDYTRAAVVAGDGVKQTAGATLAKAGGRLRFIGNNVIGKNKIATFFNIMFSPSGDLDFIQQGDAGKWNLTAKVLGDSAGLYGGTPSAPWYTLIDKQ